MALQPPSDGFFTQLVKAVSESDRPIRNIVVLTGAGISVESGVRPFNGPGGWWEEHNIKDVAHKDSDPQRVREFYEDMHRQAENATPNAAHRALAELAEKFKGKLTIITQNIDDLHEKAIRERVAAGGVIDPDRYHLYHIHGQLNQMRPGTQQRDVVLYGEQPKHMEENGPLWKDIKECDLFISIGTSDTLGAAKIFHTIANLHDAKTIKLNLEETPESHNFQEKRYGRATETVPELVKQILNNQIQVPARESAQVMA